MVQYNQLQYLICKLIMHRITLKYTTAILKVDKLQQPGLHALATIPYIVILVTSVPSPRTFIIMFTPSPNMPKKHSFSASTLAFSTFSSYQAHIIYFLIFTGSTQNIHSRVVIYSALTFFKKFLAW